MRSKEETTPTIHVVPDGERWSVLFEGSEQPESVHRSEEEALQAGRDLAEAYSSELVIHSLSGDIRERDGNSVGSND